MHYVIEYDIAAVVLSLAVMIGFFRKKLLSTSITRKFMFLGSLVAVSSSVDIVSIYFINHPDTIPLWLNYIINIAYQMPYHAMAFSFSICMSSVSQKNNCLANGKKTGFRTLIYALPCLFVEFSIITTPFTHLFFYFDSNLEYKHGVIIDFAYLISAFYLVHAFIFSFLNRKKLNSIQIFMIILFILAGSAAVLIQFFFPYLLTVGFVSALGTMLIFLSLDDPSNYLDKTLQTYNRQAFELIIAQILTQKRSTRFFALQIKDLDNINESIGQHNTDTFLRTFTSRMMSSGGRKALFRISGSRFAIILPQDKHRQKTIIENIHKMIEIPFEIEDFSITPVIAMTYFSFPEDCKTSEEIMTILENTLEEMPESDIGQVVPANPMILEKKNKEFQILQLLKKSITEEDFQVVYQPIYNLRKNKFTTAEALVRFKNLENQSLSPEEFIPIAEKNGLILPIGKIVFRKVCQFIKESNITEYGIEYIHVNLSVIQCMQQDLYKELYSVMDEYGVPYNRISFEVTETAAIVSNDSLKNNMIKLIEKGSSFSMDDYGSGYSNTVSLLRFPFSEIKLDKSVIRAAQDNSKSMICLKHTINMVKALGMKVVAEGVEDKETAQQLIDMNCDFIQGFYYSRPVSAEDFKKLVLYKG